MPLAAAGESTSRGSARHAVVGPVIDFGRKVGSKILNLVKALGLLSRICSSTAQTPQSSRIINPLMAAAYWKKNCEMCSEQ